MNGKLMFVPDTHVMVPRKPTVEMIDAGYIKASEQLPRRAHPIGGTYRAMIKAATQLTTPPVLRWEKDLTRGYIWELWFYDAVIAVAHNQGWDSMYAGSSMIKNNPEHARRAAEAALGLPIVEEV
jgi:hypothetical protein